MQSRLAIVTSQRIIALCVLGVLFLLAIYRLHRYGRHYATELFTQFLALKAKRNPDLPPPGRQSRQELGRRILEARVAPGLRRAGGPASHNPRRTSSRGKITPSARRYAACALVAARA